MRHWTVLLSLTQTCFNPAPTSTSQKSIQCMLPLKVQSITQIQSHYVLSGSHFYGRVNQSSHDNIAAPKASNPQPYLYESYSLTNCAITARHCTITDLYEISLALLLPLMMMMIIIIIIIMTLPYMLSYKMTLYFNLIVFVVRSKEIPSNFYNSLVAYQHLPWNNYLWKGANLSLCLCILFTVIDKTKLWLPNKNILYWFSQMKIVILRS